MFEASQFWLESFFSYLAKVFGAFLIAESGWECVEDRAYARAHCRRGLAAPRECKYLAEWHHLKPGHHQRCHARETTHREVTRVFREGKLVSVSDKVE
jgi:hypothetical protein